MQLLTQEQKDYLCDLLATELSYLEDSEKEKETFLTDTRNVIDNMYTSETAIADIWTIEDLRGTYEEETEGLTDDELMEILESFTNRDMENEFVVIGELINIYKENNNK